MFARPYQWMGCPPPLCGVEGREQKSTVLCPCEQLEAKPFPAKVTTAYPMVYKKCLKWEREARSSAMERNSVSQGLQLTASQSLLDVSKPPVW